MALTGAFTAPTLIVNSAYSTKQVHEGEPTGADGMAL
jgi:hypothetical protein